MDQPGPPPASSKPLPQLPPSATDNPVKGVARKVKSVLSNNQQPSIRILRGSPATPTATGEQHRVPVPTGTAVDPALPPQQNTSSNRLADAPSRARAAFRSLFGHEKENLPHHKSSPHECDHDMVDLMDVVDPEVATLSTITNVQNSLFVPSLGRFVNRRPVYRISDNPDEARTIDRLKASLKRRAIRPEDGEDENDDGPKWERRQRPLPPGRSNTIPATLSDSLYAVLPEGETLNGWTHEEKLELDDMVRHQLHSRRARGKRAMRGFWKYVHRPPGLFITTYATLIILFGAAWVLFLIGWISLGSKQDYVINIVDNVLVALFAIIGDGLAPFRAVDTYHMIYIAHYHRKTLKKREKLGLPDLVDQNDLPDQRKEDAQPAEVDLESLIARKMPRRLASRVAPRIPKKLAHRMTARIKTNEPEYQYTVLSEEQQAKLEFHERKFSKSHTFYKPHETETHYAFPFRLLILIVVLLDCHSALQISLGACTWGIPYKQRPFALTTVILCCSITCNIMGGVLISVGDKRTRKKDVIERMMRQELTSEAIQHMERRWLKEAEERGEIDRSVRKQVEEEREGAETEEVKRAWKSVPLLPKKLLGKGEDHREPSLPQEARRSETGTPSSSTASIPSPSSRRNPKSRSGGVGGAALPPVQKQIGQRTRPLPVVKRGEDPLKEAVRWKALRVVRRADLDRS